MKVSVQWLKEYVDFNRSPEELAEILTMAGLEVESMTREGEGLEEVLVAEVRSVTQHPAADHLRLCHVNVGTETFEVVCGAPNVESGMKTAFAPPGTQLAGGNKVESQEIRGVFSQGMLCSASELGIADDASGILTLDSSLPSGTQIVEAMGLKDVVLELSLTPNRPDCLGLLGVAREVAALTGGILQLPSNAVQESGSVAASLTSVSIEDPDLCPRYTARVIQGVSVGPSPLWLQRRLRACGIRAINNVVDITNYVLMETGHPLHAFDLELLRERRIIVRQARSGEVLQTLDGVERSLRPGMLVIADARDPVALAGIMGGKDSEVTPETTMILLESAYFQPTGIRRTAKTLGLSTEASYRFERGADPEMASWASSRAAGLMREIAGGEVCAGILDVYPRTIESCRIDLRVGRTNRVLGTGLDRKAVGDYLRCLGLFCQETDEDGLQVQVPTFRPDLTREIDLIEEVARLHGYNRIPSTLPRTPMRVTSRLTSETLSERVRKVLETSGFCEVITYSFIDERWMDRLRILPDDPRRTVVRLRNPISSEQGVMRTTLMPGLLETVARNISRRNYNMRLFELGRIFLGDPDPRHLPREPLTLAGVITVRNERVLWRGLNRQSDFYDVKGVVEMLGVELGITGMEVTGGVVPFLDAASSAVIRAQGRPIGVCGLLDSILQEELDLHQPVALWEIDLEFCLTKERRLPLFFSLPRYPAVLRDLAVVVDSQRSAGEVLDQIKKAGGAFLEEVILFDVFQGTPLPEGKRSLAFSLTFRAVDRTLTDEDVRLVQEEILARLRENFGAALR